LAIFLDEQLESLDKGRTSDPKKRVSLSDSNALLVECIGGIEDPPEREGWARGNRLREEWFFSQSPDIARQGWFYRMMFRLTRSIQVAQRAQRLQYFPLLA
jgi:hypothetical protein